MGLDALFASPIFGHPREALSALASRGFYVTGEDELQLTSFASDDAGLAIEGRFLNLKGELVPFAFSQTPFTDRTIRQTTFPLGEGWLINVSVRASSSSPDSRSVWAALNIVRGLTGVQQPLGALTSGYVTENEWLIWPGGQQRDMLEGQVNLRSITGTNPAAGVNITETVPVGARWRLLSCRFVLVTDATVASRTVTLTIDDGVTVYFAASSTANQAASQTGDYTASATGFAGGTAANFFAIPLPPNLLLLAGHRINTTTQLFQAGDNYGAPQLAFEEWLEVL